MNTALFLGHGSPMNVLHDNAYNRAFRQVGDSLPAPRAILCISAHGYGNGTWVGSSPRPRAGLRFLRLPRRAVSAAISRFRLPLAGG